MFSSRKTNLSTTGCAGGQTLFDFLKSKKKTSLEQSFSKSRRVSHDLSLSHIIANQQQQQTDRVPATAHQSHIKTNSLQVTPKKVSFADKDQRKDTARTLIDIISPHKTKVNLPIPKHSVLLEQSQSANKSNKKIIGNDLYTRNQLNKSINLICETISNVVDFGNNLKQKSHVIFVELKPILKIMGQQIQSQPIKKKIQSIKEKLRLMEHQFSNSGINNSQQMIEDLKQNIGVHLGTLESKIRSQFDSQYYESLSSAKEENNRKIQQLELANKNLSRNLQIMGKKLQKSQKALFQAKQSEQRISEKQHQESQAKIQQLQDQIAYHQSMNSQLSQKIKMLQNQNKANLKLIKDAKYLKQQTQKQLDQQMSEIRSTRQQFLLKQISTRKQQYQNDIKQLSIIHSLKQKELNQIIHDQLNQIKQLKDCIFANKNESKSGLFEVEKYKNMTYKYKKQNECLVTDLHRMNEELYQHWLALKDIKVLATRLQIIPKFARIYSNLSFNDLLFA